MNKDPSQIWWEDIAGPIRLVSDIKSALQNGSSVIFQSPGFIPWQDSLRDLAGAAHSVTIGLALGKDDVVPELLKEFSSRYAADCPPVYRKQIEYLKAQQVFQGSTVWISLDDNVSAEHIIRFLSDYRGNDYDSFGAFVLSISEAVPIPKISDTVQVFRYQDYVGFSSLRLFSSLIAESCPGISERMRSYASAVSASVCNPDPELLPVFLEETNFQSETPEDAMNRLWQQGVFLDPDRSTVQSSKWEHPFALIAEEDSEEFQRRVWRAQLQTLFPEIEMERTDIIRRYYEDIEAALSDTYWDRKSRSLQRVQDSVHYTITSPYDVEVGTLAFMLSLNRDEEQQQKLWYLPDPDVRERILFLRNCRNHLAHLTPCTPEEVASLLERPCGYD